MEFDIKNIENNVLASLAVENIIPSVNARKITKQFLQKKITSKQAILRIKKIYNLK